MCFLKLKCCLSEDLKNQPTLYLSNRVLTAEIKLNNSQKIISEIVSDCLEIVSLYDCDKAAIFHQKMCNKLQLLRD
jgi:hypothetical protein